MQPSFALLTLRAVSVLVAPGPEDGCPSARQVATALTERAPAAQVAGAVDSESALTLVLPRPGTPQEPSFSLLDPQGRLRLFRTLARSGTTNASDCAALSVTVAIIVQRYLEEIEMPEVEAARKRPTVQVVSPAPSPAPRVVSPPQRPVPRWDISLGIAQRFANRAGGPHGIRPPASPMEWHLGLDPIRLDWRSRRCHARSLRPGAHVEACGI